MRARKPVKPELTELQRFTVEQAREILAAANAPDWQDHQVKNLAHLEVAVKQLLEIIGELTGGVMTDAKKVEVIAAIVDRQAAAQNDEDGDRHLADAYMAMEAIEAVINDQADNPILRMYLTGGERGGGRPRGPAGRAVLRGEGVRVLPDGPAPDRCGSPSASQLAVIAFPPGSAGAIALAVVLDAVELAGEDAEFDRIVSQLTGGAR